MHLKKNLLPWKIGLTTWSYRSFLLNNSPGRIESNYFIDYFMYWWVGGIWGGGLTDLILRCWSIGKSKPFKEIISPFHRRLLLNLRLWNGVWLWRISGVTNRRWRGWFSPKIQYKSAQIVYSRNTRARQIIRCPYRCL